MVLVPSSKIFDALLEGEILLKKDPHFKK